MARGIVLLLLFLLFATPTFAASEDVGERQTNSGETCDDIFPNPVAGKSWCRDADSQSLYVWSGSAWVLVGPSTGGSGSTVRTFVAAGCNAASTAVVAGFDIPSSNGPVLTCFDTGGGTRALGALEYDESTQQSAETWIELPSTWGGSITVDINWFATTGSGDVVWSIETMCVAVGDNVVSGNTYNTAQTATSTSGGANISNTVQIASLTTTGCASDKTLWMRVSRVAADSGDTLNAKAYLRSLRVAGI